jgi:TolB-like protein
MLGGAIFWQYARHDASGTAADAAGAAKPTAMATDASVAVLPFVDMSQSKDQEYFADGLAEELLNLLARVPELRVIGRTSSFQFKGKNEDLRQIAAKLGVANLLEGSVRRAGSRVRITAQLIKAVDGSHLWSETYERNLDDIFAVQDDIASAVATAMQVRLLPKQMGARAPYRTASTARTGRTPAMPVFSPASGASKRRSRSTRKGPRSIPCRRTPGSGGAFS